ncbi:MAG: SDR family NAD(P)-dependent oxidoreductase [Verrucomicrobiales bacterium]
MTESAKTSVAIIGASSAMGEALVRQLAERGEALFLTARDAGKLEKVAADARLRGAREVRTQLLDLADWEGDLDWLRSAGELSAVVIAPGVLSDEEGGLSEWRADVGVNFTALAFLAREACELLAAQNDGGCLQIIGSVAGDRGRQSNGFYGAQKAALATYVESLAHRAALKNKKVRVLLVKPGLVRSAMTSDLPESPLFSEPEAVARVLVKALTKRKAGVVYAPWWWRWVMLVIRLIPRVIFHRSKL